MQGVTDNGKKFRNSFDHSKKPFSSQKPKNNIAPLCLKMLVVTTVMNGLARRIGSRKEKSNWGDESGGCGNNNPEE